MARPWRILIESDIAREMWFTSKENAEEFIQKLENAELAYVIACSEELPIDNGCGLFWNVMETHDRKHDVTFCGGANPAEQHEVFVLKDGRRAVYVVAETESVALGIGAHKIKEHKARTA